ncbi:GntR family transcriptional regulator [Streptomyces sp. NPDC012746]|uniref:GntR family transcriptional regulator n=1 Tax=Streptomyces sp. NPDC012746 TaxID=3364845 RepID=UPI0036848E64
MPMQQWRELADRLAARIESGEFHPGARMPTTLELMAEGESKPSVERAYRDLVERGLVVRKPRVGTVVRSRVRVRVPLSRYGAVLRPDGDKGPWETAAAGVGLGGSVVPLAVGHIDAPAEIAVLLGLEPGTLVVRRARHALIDEEVVQTQEAFYPADVAEACGLDQLGKVVGGVLGAMTACGLGPESADEKVTARMPTKAEADELGMGERVPVLCVERVVRGRGGRVLEVLRVVGAADRVELHYDELPMTGGVM